MLTIVPTAAAAYAAILGLLAAALTVRVIVKRVSTGVQAGDGGNASLAHPNLLQLPPEDHPFVTHDVHRQVAG